MQEVFVRARPHRDIQTFRGAILVFIKGLYSTSIKAKLLNTVMETFDKVISKATDVVDS